MESVKSTRVYERRIAFAPEQLELIRNAFIEQKLSKTQIAIELGLSGPAIVFKLQGKRSFTETEVNKLQDILKNNSSVGFLEQYVTQEQKKQHETQQVAMITNSNDPIWVEIFDENIGIIRRIYELSPNHGKNNINLDL